MKKIKHKILSTKFLDQQTFDKAALSDIEIDELAFIKTEPVNDPDLKKTIKEFLQENITAVFTSKNAVKAFEQIVNAEVNWKIFCIGQSTKKLVAKVFGETKISSTADNALELAEIILQDKEINKVAFFCGQQRREELPEKLRSEKVEVEEIVVYETHETPQKISKKHYDGILFFSPSAVNSFFSLNKINEHTQIFAIGKTTAEAIYEYDDREIICAEIPSEENIITRVIEHCGATKNNLHAVKK